MPTQILTDATIPELPNHYKGKVRDCYTLDDGRRVMITTDRLSAFDAQVCAIPDKGRILTQIARFWFERTIDLSANHVLSYPDPNVVIGKQLRIIPVEIVVRDYLAGTTATALLPMYKAGRRDMYGITFPDGLRDNSLLPFTVITPTTKSDTHDLPITPDQIIERGLMTEDQWEEIEDRSMLLFDRGKQIARAGGLLLVDTKYEFGLDENDRIILADEIHTPDSSRYWFASSYENAFITGTAPPSLDKDVIRRWIGEQCDPYIDGIPPIPPELIDQTATVYANAYYMITREELPPIDNEPILDRIRQNLTRDGILMDEDMETAAIHQP